jgi:hypothetical protein
MVHAEIFEKVMLVLAQAELRNLTWGEEYRPEFAGNSIVPTT